MATNTTLLRVRVPAQRLKNVEKILAQLGLGPGDAFNMLLAQIELRRGVPFEIITLAESLSSSSEDQGTEWIEAFGVY